MVGSYLRCTTCVLLRPLRELTPGEETFAGITVFSVEEYVSPPSC